MSPFFPGITVSRIGTAARRSITTQGIRRIATGPTTAPGSGHPVEDGASTICAFIVRRRPAGATCSNRHPIRTGGNRLGRFVDIPACSTTAAPVSPTTAGTSTNPQCFNVARNGNIKRSVCREGVDPFPAGGRNRSACGIGIYDFKSAVLNDFQGEGGGG